MTELGLWQSCYNIKTRQQIRPHNKCKWEIQAHLKLARSGVKCAHHSKPKTSPTIRGKTPRKSRIITHIHWALNLHFQKQSCKEYTPELSEKRKYLQMYNNFVIEIHQIFHKIQIQGVDLAQSGGIKGPAEEQSKESRSIQRKTEPPQFIRDSITENQSNRPPRPKKKKKKTLKVG